MIDAQPRFRTHPYLQQRFATVGRKLAFACKDRKEWQSWRRKTVRKLKGLTGYDTMQTAPLNSRVTDEIELADHIRQRVEIQVEPGLYMPMFVCLPKNDPGPYPAVIAPHGHGSGGKIAVAGCREIPGMAKVIKQYNYDYGVQFARAGFAAFCPDARGFGERLEKDVEGGFNGRSCQWLNQMGNPLGQTVTGMWAWDLHRLTDYIETRDDCVPGAIGCAGLSGGGLQTLWTAALDTRIRCAVVSGYFYGFKESLLDTYNCSCNYVPHLYEHVDIGDVGALIAPRPLFIETGDKDNLNGASGLNNVKPQVRTVRKAYRLLDAGGKIKHDIFAGEHRWHGVKAIPWMHRQLGGFPK
jgi:dienelactone hydrolase